VPAIGSRDRTGALTRQRYGQVLTVERHLTVATPAAACAPMVLSAAAGSAESHVPQDQKCCEKARSG